jgi:hypothetical protein
MALAAGGLLLLPYAVGPIYSFPEPAAFAGASLHNPYARSTGSWQRANLHAHGSAWGGMTSGTQPSTAVVQRYRDLGYSVPGVSNYHHIAAHDGVPTLPLYEHGINLGKYHQLAIGARAVEWFDFPLWQSLSHRQYVIDRVKRKAALVSLNHPDSRDAYGNEALRYLTGYDMIEVANGPFTTEGLWDEALSAGRMVWAVANDDTHDLTDPRRMAVGWNMVDAASASDADIIEALRAGRFYAVLRTGALESAHLTRLERMDVRGHTMTVTLAGAPAAITFVGQDGAIRKAVNAALSADYTLTPDDTYVRAVVHAAQTVLFLNPVVRWDGRRLPAKAARVDAAATWLFRGGLLAAGALLLVRARRRQPVLAPNGTPARP